MITISFRFCKQRDVGDVFARPIREPSEDVSEPALKYRYVPLLPEKLQREGGGSWKPPDVESPK
jgi:hypothetical protein